MKLKKEKKNITIVFFFSPVPDYVKCTVDTVMGIHREEGQGDILAFLTGQVYILAFPLVSTVLVIKCIFSSSLEKALII